MKIKTKALKSVLDVMGGMKPDTLYIRQEETGWEFYVLDTSLTMMAMGTVKPAALQDYVPGETLALDPEFLSDVLSKDEWTDVSVTDGKITVSSSAGKDTKRLRSADDMPAVRIPRVTPQNSTSVVTDDLAKAVGDKRMILKGSASIAFRMKELSLEISASNDSGDSTVRTVEAVSTLAEEDVEPVSAYNHLVVGLVKSLPKGEMATVTYDSDVPMFITVDTDDFMVKTLIAPIIEGD